MGRLGKGHPFSREDETKILILTSVTFGLDVLHLQQKSVESPVSSCV